MGSRNSPAALPRWSRVTTGFAFASAARLAGMPASMPTSSRRGCRLLFNPASYALDVGVTYGGRTPLVEANGGCALGSYGLRHNLYAKLLPARWAQMVDVPDECGFWCVASAASGRVLQRISQSADSLHVFQGNRAKHCNEDSNTQF